MEGYIAAPNVLPVGRAARPVDAEGRRRPLASGRAAGRWPVPGASHSGRRSRWPTIRSGCQVTPFLSVRRLAETVVAPLPRCWGSRARRSARSSAGSALVKRVRADSEARSGEVG